MHLTTDDNNSRREKARKRPPSALEVFKVMDEDRAFDLVAVRTASLDGAGHWWRAAGEDADLTNVAVQLLQTFEEAVKLWPAEVCDGA